ncbi:MAG: beta-phosphoglucomutase [Phycisphaerales bacterium]|nr:MAG: beta-phosphoglucomutase [Phycisphaerales bacterium]
MSDSPSDTNPGWSIIEEPFDAATSKAWEGLFTLGSGYLHLRGSLEEHLQDAPQNRTYLRQPADVTSEEFPDRKAKWGTYVPGIYGSHPLLNAELINLPWFLGIAPEVEGERLDMEHGRIEAHRRTLDLRQAMLRRELRWHTRAGAIIEITFERFVSAARPHLCLQRMKMTTDRAVEVTIRAGIDADVRTNGFDHFQAVGIERAGPAEIHCRVRTDGNDEVRIASCLLAESADWRYEPGDRRGGLVAALTVGPSRPLIMEKRSAVSASRDLDGPEASLHLREIEQLTWEVLLAEHASAWRERWDACDVLIEGDDESQLAVRVALFHLLRAHVPDDPRVAIDAKGYGGEAYWGRFFWDTEMFLLPFYLYTDPDRARTLVDFRRHTLDGARDNARRYGYDGARYAWESDPAGQECCPNWQYADHEVHITADAVYGLAHYAAATGQAEYLHGPAAEVVVETARYWLQRIDPADGEQRFSLRGVMGPDEYTPISDDNAYTNRLVAFNLNLAAEVGESGGASAAEREAFARAAATLPILRHPDDDTLVLQCDGFHRLADPRFDELWRDRRRPFATQVSQERLYRSRCLKQADVLMLMMLFPDEFTDDQVRRAWDYYVPLTTHDSSLSAGVHAIVASRLGKCDEAWSFWRQASMIDLNVEDGGAAEGIHIAAAGAVWQVVTLGFAGMKTALHCDTLTLAPCLPGAWRRLSFPLIWRGCPVLVDIRPDTVTVSNRSAEADIAVCVYGRRQDVRAGRSCRWDTNTGLLGVIFDLDGVLVTTDELHYQSWKELADAEGIPFDRSVNERLRGVSRMTSLEIILEQAGREYPEEQKRELAARKNQRYRQLLEALTAADVAPGAIELLDGLKRHGAKIAVASSSRNARLILERLSLAERFDSIVDGNDTATSKPDPRIFMLASERLGLPPRRCVVVEDAAAGVEAARGAGMAVVGIGSAAKLAGAGIGGDDLSSLAVEDLLKAGRMGR